MVYKPNLLCIVPPYPITVPPAAPAALLAYLKAKGCREFDFLDLRLWVPQSYATTFSPVGVFGESYVIDVADLPLVLRVISAFEDGRPAWEAHDDLFERYCIERGINPGYLQSYLAQMERFLESTFSQLENLEFVGFTVWNSNYLTTLMAAAYLKRRRSPPFIMAGGPHVTESPNSAKLALKSGLFDLVALGEGEETLSDTYEHFQSGRKEVSGPIAGTMRYAAHSGEFHASKRALLKITELPSPDFESLDLPAYQRNGQRLRVVPFQLSRGCTDKCSFCSEWGLWERFRSDSIERVLCQLEQLVTNYNIQGIAFTDSLLNGVMPRLKAFAEGILERQIKIKWGGFMRANMDAETAALLRRAGCVLGFFGIESFDDETLKEMNKRRTMTDNLRALEAFLEAGIAVRAGFIPGFPGDDRNRFLKTATVFRNLQQKYPELLSTSIEPFVVAPGQPIFNDLSRYGLTPKGWDEEYLTLAPKYRDLTEHIYCEVEGDNQGIERLGQYQIAITLSQNALNKGKTQQHASSVQNADFMHYSYNPEEQESTFNIDIEHLFGNCYLGLFKTLTSLIYGCLLTQEEKDRYQNLWAEEHAERPWMSSKALLDRPAINSFLTQVERSHIVISPREIPRIQRPMYKRCIDRSDLISLSPFLIARSWEEQGKIEVILVNVCNRQYHMASADINSILTFLDGAPRSLLEVQNYCESSAQPTSWSGIVSTLDELKEKGMLLITGGAETRPTHTEVGERVESSVSQL
jgi:radical SAM superfamily enzyme YgiQ (UPF0313 family)